MNLEMRRVQSDSREVCAKSQRIRCLNSGDVELRLVIEGRLHVASGRVWSNGTVYIVRPP